MYPRLLSLCLLLCSWGVGAFIPFFGPAATPGLSRGTPGGRKEVGLVYAKGGGRKKKGAASRGKEEAGKAMGSQPPLAGTPVGNEEERQVEEEPQQEQQGMEVIAEVAAAATPTPEPAEAAQIILQDVGTEDEDTEEVYDQTFVLEQKKLREKLDFSSPYARERPRNWDFITGLPVPLHIKLKKMFPFADEQTRKRYRQPFPNDFEYMAERIKETFTKTADKEELRSWYIANRDWLGQQMRLILPAKSLKYVQLGQMEEAQKWHDAFEMYRLVESSVTCHLQQAMREAEARLSQNLGNLDMTIVGGNNPAERTAMWLILKSVLAKWEARREKYANIADRTMVQERALSGTRKVVDLFQRMNLAFSECEPVMKSTPVEVQFLDKALTIRSGTELRRWTLKEFCPENGLTVEDLRERVRALYHIIEDLLHEEMSVLHEKILDIYRAIALGTAEFETEDSMEVIFRSLPPSASDPEAPFPFTLERRLDAGGSVNKTVAITASDKLDIVLKSVGVPFPESTKQRMDARQQGEDLWYDRWALLWGQKPEEWFAERNVPVTQQLSGTFSQDYIDRMQREITRRRQGADGEEENPIYTWQYEYIEKTEEEKAKYEEWLVAQRANKTMVATYIDPEDPTGQTILSEEEVQAKYLSDPDWKPPPLPHPKKWAQMLRARNAKWDKIMWERRRKEAVEVMKGREGEAAAAAAAVTADEAVGTAAA